jgi:hypothetical protein
MTLSFRSDHKPWRAGTQDAGDHGGLFSVVVETYTREVLGDPEPN